MPRRTKRAHFVIFEDSPICKSVATQSIIAPECLSRTSSMDITLQDYPQSPVRPTHHTSTLTTIPATPRVAPRRLTSSMPLTPPRRRLVFGSPASPTAQEPLSRKPVGAINRFWPTPVPVSVDTGAKGTAGPAALRFASFCTKGEGEAPREHSPDLGLGAAFGTDSETNWGIVDPVHKPGGPTLAAKAESLQTVHTVSTIPAPAPRALPGLAQRRPPLRIDTQLAARGCGVTAVRRSHARVSSLDATPRTRRNFLRNSGCPSPQSARLPGSPTRSSLRPRALRLVMGNSIGGPYGSASTGLASPFGGQGQVQINSPLSLAPTPGFPKTPHTIGIPIAKSKPAQAQLIAFVLLLVLRLTRTQPPASFFLRLTAALRLLQHRENLRRIQFPTRFGAEECRASTATVPDTAALPLLGLGRKEGGSSAQFRIAV